MSKHIAVTLQLPQEAYNDLLVVVERCNRANERREGFTSHGKLDVAGLLTMLAQDAAATNSRPGSWEGANMQQVLTAHGYD